MLYNNIEKVPHTYHVSMRNFSLYYYVYIKQLTQTFLPIPIFLPISPILAKCNFPPISGITNQLHHYARFLKCFIMLYFKTKWFGGVIANTSYFVGLSKSVVIGFSGVYHMEAQSWRRNKCAPWELIPYSDIYCIVSTLYYITVHRIETSPAVRKMLLWGTFIVTHCYILNDSNRYEDVKLNITIFTVYNII